MGSLYVSDPSPKAKNCSPGKNQWRILAFKFGFTNTDYHPWETIV